MDKLMSVDKSINISEVFGNNTHINSIEVYTGGDDYTETEMVTVSVVNHKLKLQKEIDHFSKSENRARFEPCARIYVDTECGNRHCLHIYHHKGSVYVDFGRL